MTKLNIGNVYTFNVNPEDKYQYFTAPKRHVTENGRLEQFEIYWRSMFDSITEHNIGLYLQTELSEPITGQSKNQSSRLHFHGYIEFEDIHSLKWFLLYGTVLLSRVSTYEIDTIADPDHWYGYVHKQKFLGLPDISTCGMEERIVQLKGNPLNSQVIAGVEGDELCSSPPPPIKITTKKDGKIKKKIKKYKNK